ncbi:HK97 gp10 family phage protein [Acidovorax sp. FJL06]|uniref:HK97 gp10 family phage protein n=1 Tax=Acidovorax sp. FJL06 TaxID=2153365 RepID=UPI000F586B26|nr:HK97 gp10 family phage protein [Acidovorax sp. FJL06]RQO83488.1 hypothetical protein DBV10_03965 [Acidovorax sp. FJL06]
MGFAANLNKLCERAGDKAALVVRRAALELQSGMIERSPVDTGRFKGNWQCGIGSLNAATNSAADSSGQGALGRTATTLQGWTPGQTIVLSNSLPYAKRLENGWSQQAPSGMVRLTVQAYSDAVKKAVESIK